MKTSSDHLALSRFEWNARPGGATNVVSKTHDPAVKKSGGQGRMMERRNREVDQAGEPDKTSSATTPSTNSRPHEESPSPYDWMNGSASNKTLSVQVENPASLLNLVTAPPSSSSNPLPPPDDDDVERERETTIILHLNIYGKAQHVRDIGIRTKRELEVVGIKPNRVLQDIGPGHINVVIEDDFSDDKGEMWHAHNWTVEDPEDEGLHRYDVT